MFLEDNDNATPPELAAIKEAEHELEMKEMNSDHIKWKVHEEMWQNRQLRRRYKLDLRLKVGSKQENEQVHPNVACNSIFLFRLELLTAT